MRLTPKPHIFAASVQDDLFSDEFRDDLRIYSAALESAGLPVIIDPNHFSISVGYKIEFLYAVSNAQRPFYRHFYIAKRNGGRREIFEPLPSLKALQTLLRVGLFSYFPVSRAARAYRQNYTVKGNASIHRGQKNLIKIDFKNFFGSIRTHHVYNLLYSAGYTEQLSALIANIVTLDGALPQGAPTSPCISNAVMFDFDEKLLKYCQDRNWRYTRYADDISISGNSLDFHGILRQVRSQANEMGIELNKKKTLVLRNGAKKTVTGLTVNDKVNTPRHYRRRIRQEMHYINRYGLDAHLSKIGEFRSGYIDNIMGRISYVQSVCPTREFEGYRATVSLLRRLIKQTS